MSAFFNSACFHGIFMLQQVSELHYFLWPNSIPLCGYTTTFYLFKCWWAFGLFPPCVYYEWCYYKHSCVSFCVDLSSFLNRYISKKDMQRPISTLKMAQHHLPLEKCKAKPQWYTISPTRMATIKKTDNSKHWWTCGAAGTLTHCWGECQRLHHFGKQPGSFQTIKYRITIWPRNSTHNYRLV